jgi:LPXTG-motif cell wall-anchored protein
VRRVVIGFAAALLASLLLGAAAAAQGAATVSTAQSAQLGTILVGPNGKTLYHFTKDSYGQSVCSGPCAQLWPPLTVSGAPAAGTGVTGKLGVITRADGSRQVTYNGAPLYYFAGDKKPGDTTGQGYKSVWYVATPTLALSAAQAAPAGARLPKTGADPWATILGLALVSAGVTLFARARRRTAV